MIVIVSEYKVGEWGNVIGASDNWPDVIELCKDHYTEIRRMGIKKYTLRYCGKRGRIKNIYNDLSSVEIVEIENGEFIGKKYEDVRINKLFKEGVV
jgi:hypothetical protein